MTSWTSWQRPQHHDYRIWQWEGFYTNIIVNGINFNESDMKVFKSVRDIWTIKLCLTLIDFVAAHVF